MPRRRKPLEFSDPYEEGLGGWAGNSNWSAAQVNKPSKRKSREDELKDMDKFMREIGKCPNCGSISPDYAGYTLCPECGYEG